MVAQSLVSLVFAYVVLIVGAVLALQLVAHFGFVGLGVVLIAVGFMRR